MHIFHWANDVSRGLQIRLFENVFDALDYTSDGAHAFIAQKYIERPLLIRKKKFDIRQWVLVSSVNPLTIYLGDAYIRFCTAEYDDENIDDRFVSHPISSIKNNQF